MIMKNKEGEINGIIYGVRNRSNEKWYVGLTTAGLEKRRRQHLTDARYNRDRCVFHAAIHVQIQKLKTKIPTDKAGINVNCRFC